MVETIHDKSQFKFESEIKENQSMNRSISMNELNL